MKKVFISQPMNGLTKEEIFAERDKAAKAVEEKIGEPVIVLDTFILEDAPRDVNAGLWYLAKSLMVMSDADVAYFCKGWENARGCRIEHDCAVEYGIVIEGE